MKPKPDARTRKRLFVPGAMSHPAKGHIGLWQEIIERYTKQDDWVLDPMAGIGTTLVAALVGRNVICAELEPHFVEPMLASWRKMQGIGPMLGHQMGKAVIIRGDARALPLGSVDGVITSPPYEESYSRWGDNKNDLMAAKGLEGKYTRPDAIVTSLPFQDVTAQLGEFKPPNDRTETEKRLRRERGGYTRPSAIITSPPYEGVANAQKNTNTNDAARGFPTAPLAYTQPDAIVTSPPYEQAHGDAKRPQDGKSYQDRLHNYNYGSKLKFEGDAVGNIGNLRGPAYWEAMTWVYQECHRILRPGGLMVLVLKGFTRNGQYQDLPEQTRQLVETLGFSCLEKWTRELWSLSFWRILQARKYGLDERLKYEWVYVFRAR